MIVLFWNCSHGALPKIDMITSYLKDFKPSLFFISEAEIKPDRDYSCLFVEGYDVEVSKTISAGKMARSIAYVKKDSGFVRCLNLEDGESELIVFTNGKNESLRYLPPV
jgi:hypothetical protein